jgi:prepilin-type processing-associated H-X9-DG protein
VIKDFEDTLGEAARDVLLRVYDGAALTHPQTGGGCYFWFLDGSVVDDAGPRELHRRELITTPAPGLSIALTDRGRVVAERLRSEP